MTSFGYSDFGSLKHIRDINEIYRLGEVFGERDGNEIYHAVHIKGNFPCLIKVVTKKSLMVEPINKEFVKKEFLVLRNTSHSHI